MVILQTCRTQPLVIHNEKSGKLYTNPAHILILNRHDSNMHGDAFRMTGVRSQRVRRLLHIDQRETEKLRGIFLFLCHLIPVLAQVHPVIESFLGQ